MTARNERVQLGYVSGLYGVRGWIKVFSYTDPPHNIFQYSPWQLDQGSRRLDVVVAESRRRGAGLAARLEGYDDRDGAAALVGAEIWVSRDRLPATGAGEYYWADLIGLDVNTVDGVPLGTVERLFETGANDVLVVTGERERLVPWIRGDVVTDVDLAAGRITVRWDPDF